MAFDWKRVHLANENIYNGRLNWHRGIAPPPPPPREDGDHGGDEEQQQIPTDWDFSHLDGIIETKLQQKPDHDLYLYGSVESAYDPLRPGADTADQAPIIVGITLPNGRVPTRLVGRINNQRSEEEQLMNFEELNYSWVTAGDPSFGGRVHYLACNADMSAVPDDEEEAMIHRYCSLFVLTQHDMRTNKHGNYIVDYIQFSFVGQDGQEITGNWDRSDGSLSDEVDELVEIYFEDSSVEDRDVVRERIMQAAQAEIASIRQRKGEKLNLFFGQESIWNQDSIDQLSVFKVTPVNFPASITTIVDRFFNEFSKHQDGGALCYSDHSSISGGSLVGTVPTNVLDRFGNAFEPSSPTALLFTTILVDFLKSTSFIQKLPSLNIMSSEAPVIFERVIETFGIDRVMQHFGQNTKAHGYETFVKPRLRDVVRNVLCHKLEEGIKRANRVPHTPKDYLLNFNWQNQDSSNLMAFPVVDSIRLGRSNNDVHAPRIRDPISLEARSTMTRAGVFVPISLTNLKMFVSESYIPELLLDLLYDPLTEVQVKC